MCVLDLSEYRLLKNLCNACHLVYCFMNVEMFESSSCIIYAVDKCGRKIATFLKFYSFYLMIHITKIYSNNVFF